MSGLDRFQELFDLIREGAVKREQQRVLPFDQIRGLADAGFTSLRVPAEFGGAGISLPELFDLLIELAAADPNVPQALRGHLSFVEKQLVLLEHGDDPARAERWLRRVAGGLVVGNAQAEAGPLTTTDTRIVRDGDEWVLTGRKFYTTGTIYADATWSAAIGDDEKAYGVVVPTASEQVTVLDDWTGFGQRLTGSGTTLFEGVRLTGDEVYAITEEPGWFAVDYRVMLHLILQATMAGIGLSAERETIDFVRSRTRSFGVPGEAPPRHDPRVHTVVGDIASRVAGVLAIVRDVARDYEQTRARQRLERTDDERYEDAVRLQIRQFEAQQIAVDDVLAVTTKLFEVGGASAVLAEKGFDRHWRNARTIASHNPAVFRKAAIGDWLLNGTPPERAMR